MKYKVIVFFISNCLILANLLGQEIDLDSIYKNKNYGLLENYLKSGVYISYEELYLENSSMFLNELSNMISSFIKSGIVDERRIKDYWVIHSDTLKVLIVDKIEVQDSSRQLEIENDSDSIRPPKSPTFPFYSLPYYAEKAIKVESIKIYPFLTEYLKKEPIWITEEIRKKLDCFIKGRLVSTSNSQNGQVESPIEFYNRIKFISKFLTVKLGVDPIFFTSEIHIWYVIVDEKLEEAQIGYYTPWSGGIALMNKTDDIWILKKKKVSYIE